jgi:hypothetical protein
LQAFIAEVEAMRQRTDETPPRQLDRDRQQVAGSPDESRNFERQVSEVGVDDDAPFDENGEPIQDEEINTHGSER